MNCHLTSFNDIKRKKLGPQKSLFYLRGPQKGPRKKGFLGLFGDVPPPPLDSWPFKCNICHNIYFLTLLVTKTCLLYKYIVCNCQLYKYIVCNCLLYKYIVCNCQLYKYIVCNCQLYKDIVCNCLLYKSTLEQILTDKISVKLRFLEK